MQNGSVKDNLELSQDAWAFAVFCIENLAIKLGLDPSRVYTMLTVESDLLYSYIFPCYDVLHTQDKEYIMTDLIELMKRRGVLK